MPNTINRRTFLHLSALTLAGTEFGCAGHSPSKSLPNSTLPSAQIELTDITDGAGIHFTAVNGRSPHRYFIETMGSGCAFIDYDGDGWQDILLLSGHTLPGSYSSVNGPSLRLFHNNRNGTFTDVTAAVGLADTKFFAYGVAVGDFDNDGYSDFYVTCALGPGHLFKNEGGKRFANVTAASGITDDNGLWGTSCCWVDYDNDGHLDLFICNYVRYRTLKDDMPCKIAANVYTYCIPNAFPPTTCRLYHNNGNGTFTDVTVKSGISAAMAKGLGVLVYDYDDDGYQDLFVACDTVPSLLLHNKGNGTFEELGLQSGFATDAAGNPHSGMGIDVAMIANTAAIVLGNYTTAETCLYREVSTGIFQDEAGNNGVGPPSHNNVGFGALFADFANRGVSDVLVINGHVQDNIHQFYPYQHYRELPLLYQGNGNGRFQALNPAGPLATPIVGRGAAKSNLFNDGKICILVTTNGGPAYLWQSSGPQGNWLGIHLVGNKSNRSGIGTKVTVHMPDGTTQVDTCRSGSSYLSASDLRLHFGLGAVNQGLDVELRWPSGLRETHKGLAPNKIWTITEGNGAVATSA